MSLIYGLVIVAAIMGAGWWIYRAYRTDKHQRVPRIQWHRLIANNIYLTVLHIPNNSDWEIRISVIEGDNRNITISSEDKGKVIIDIEKSASLETLDRIIENVTILNPAVKLFLAGINNTARAAPLFPNKKDYEVYKELIFYLKTSLENN